jgi:hypothetical protein
MYIYSHGIELNRIRLEQAGVLSARSEVRVDQLREKRKIQRGCQLR